MIRECQKVMLNQFYNVWLVVMKYMFCFMHVGSFLCLLTHLKTCYDANKQIISLHEVLTKVC